MKNLHCQISELYIYPIKSMAGISLERSTLSQHGLTGDRQWMLVNQNNRAITQRQVSRMALITSKISDNKLIIAMPGMGEIEVIELEEDKTIDVGLFKDRCNANIACTEVGQWLADALQLKETVNLVKFNPKASRSPGAIERFGQESKHFADAAPYLITNQSSLERLNQNLKQNQIAEVSNKHFRPNIVLSGLDAFEEQEIGGIESEEVHLQFIDPSSRCAVITIDPTTGERRNNNTPFKQLAELNPMPNQPKVPAFGMNSVAVKGQGQEISIGDQFRTTT